MRALNDAMHNFKLSRPCLLFTCLLTVLLISFLYLSSPSIDSEIHNAPLILTTDSEDGNQVPAKFLQSFEPLDSNVSYCEYNFNFPRDLDFADGDLNFGAEQGKEGPYRILYNVVAAKIAPDTPAITYATHVTADFMNYIPELVRYWDGLISIAAFVPDLDVALVLRQLNQYCYCLPGMARVSLHLVIDKTLPPSRKDVYFTKPDSCEVEDSSQLQTYRNVDEKVMYPINVCRNAARTAALTEHVLVSDIQLMPSGNLARSFLEMIDQYKLADCQNRVFVLPIFEVEEGQEIPRTKERLQELIGQEKAVYFHRHICSHCQRFPGIEAWLVSDPGDTVKPLATVRREVPYHRWEPIYIGTKNEPLYNELLSWEGLQDKMLQMLEMCLIGYKFVILDGAYLVHWPGMKKTKTKDEEPWRIPFIKKNSEEYKKYLTSLIERYAPKRQCKIQ
ncbi:unnamed protein product [Phaedon cochleariae]|uniref:N-acetyllactosaminide beta-1,3-N-acetylglucosaminyltransferase n=1 Tax=Phaedon cochleariae TaxID=80249 RepID=A0A9N9SH32_PHACE|nr:unnamed protein product [Phaedon cochleariae]